MSRTKFYFPYKTKHVRHCLPRICQFYNNVKYRFQDTVQSLEQQGRLDFFVDGGEGEKPEETTSEAVPQKPPPRRVCSPIPSFV